MSGGRYHLITCRQENTRSSFISPEVGFGAEAVGPSGRVRKADLVLPGHLGMGRHLFLDTAIADPTHAWKRVFKMYSPDYHPSSALFRLRTPMGD